MPLNVNMQSFGTQELRRDLGQLAVLTKKGIGKEIRFSAARLAENLAVATQPFGRAAGKKKGMDKVSRDILKVFIQPSTVFSRLEKIAGKPTADAFWALQKKTGAKATQQALDITRKASMRSIKGFSPVSEQLHKSRRVRGAVKKGGDMYIVSNPSKLKALITKKQKMVGFAKAGWLACVQALKKRPKSGLQYVSRHHGIAPHMVNDLSESTMQSVYIENSIPYVSNLINNTSYRTAIQKERNSIREQIKNILEKQTEKLNKAA